VPADPWKQLLPGFADPVDGAQRTFRAALDAVARPGRIRRLDVELAPPEPLDPATAAVALALFDLDTRIWTDLPHDSEAVRWCRFHCGAPITRNPKEADFALVLRPGEMPDLDRFHPGTDRRPETGATLLVQVAALEGGPARRLTGPGIRDEETFSPDGPDASFWEKRKRQTDAFPLGVDILFTQGRRLAALPRSTRID
jgi:alpha-D-ribose 1-methylphosphonate 5-triphosphate synthase subunit PhnH